MWFHDKHVAIDDVSFSRVANNLLNTLPTYSGGRLNKKDGLTRYGDSHVKDKTS